MYSIIYNLYFCIKRYQKRLIEKNKKQSNLCNKIIGYIEAYYNIYWVKKIRKKYSFSCINNNKQRDKKIIVSLTSFPKRIDTVWITIVTLLNQSLKPDKIILWLAKEQFNGINSLPENLTKLQKYGLQIRFCDDLRSHKKYYYTMLENPEDIVILFDDDMFYPKNTIKKLYELHKRFPNDICAINTQVMNGGFESMPSTWRNPYIKEKVITSDKVQIFTGSGSLFPPYSLDSEVFNKDAILKLCPYADDLWLTFMAYKNNTKISSISKWRSFPITIYNTEEERLWYINSEGGQNDEQWVNLLNNYKSEVI